MKIQPYSGRNILKELESSGKYVFHGSGEKLEFLEPRQAYKIINGKKVKDDKPAVHVSFLADIAIFMAIINEVHCQKGLRSGYSYNAKGRVTYKASSKTLRQVHENSEGYVYVFPKENIVARSQIEGVSYTSITPIFVVEVWKRDIPKGIIVLRDPPPQSSGKSY